MATSRAPRGAQEKPITREAVEEWAKSWREHLKAMDTETRRQTLSLLGFEATLGDAGDVKQASMAVPTTHHCTNIGMTTWM